MQDQRLTHLLLFIASFLLILIGSFAIDTTQIMLIIGAFFLISGLILLLITFIDWRKSRNAQ